MPEDMMISMDTEAPDSGPDLGGGEVGGFDQAIADMKNTLGGGEGESAPEVPQNRPQTAPPAFDRSKAYQGAVKKQQRTWQQRQAQKNAELTRLREIEAAQQKWQEQTAETVKLLRELAQLQTGGREEQIPDPVLDPAGFQAYVQKGNNSALEAQMKPVLEKLQGLTGRIEEADRQRAAVEAQQRQIDETVRGYEDEIEQYRELYPELEYGAEDRIIGGMDLLTEVFAERLGWGGVGEKMVQTIFTAIARTAAQDGTLGIMAIDQFATGLIESAAARVIEHYAAMGYDLPPFQALSMVMEGNGGAPAAPAPRPAPPSPAQREIARQEAVRQRGASAGNVRPRQPARGTTVPQSKAAVLALDYRSAGRDVDWNAVMKTALQESGGNRMRAQQIYQEACKLVDAA